MLSLIQITKSQFTHYLHKAFAYCYHSVYVTSFLWSQSDHIKQCKLYYVNPLFLLLPEDADLNVF
jgi:hypothetical protein